MTNIVIHLWNIGEDEYNDYGQEYSDYSGDYSGQDSYQPQSGDEEAEEPSTLYGVPVDSSSNANGNAEEPSVNYGFPSGDPLGQDFNLPREDPANEADYTDYGDENLPQSLTIDQQSAEAPLPFYGAPPPSSSRESST